MGGRQRLVHEEDADVIFLITKNMKEHVLD